MLAVKSGFAVFYTYCRIMYDYFYTLADDIAKIIIYNDSVLHEIYLDIYEVSVNEITYSVDNHFRLPLVATH